MSSFIGDIANAFRFGTMTNRVERNVIAEDLSSFDVN